MKILFNEEEARIIKQGLNELISTNYSMFSLDELNTAQVIVHKISQMESFNADKKTETTLPFV